MAAEEEEAHEQEHHAHMASDFKSRFWICVAATAPVLALSPMIQSWLGLTETISFPYQNWVLLSLSTFIYAYGGYPFVSGMVYELKNRNPGMMTLVGIAISVAFFYSAAVIVGLTGKLFFWETATLIDLMLLGHWVEMRSVTGESEPATKKSGDEVTGGSVNGSGSVVVEVEKVGADSYLRQVVKLVREAQESMSRTQSLADRAAFYLTVVGLSAGVLTLVVWYFVLGRDFAFSLERTVTVMVITCPHALGLAIPPVVTVSTGIGAKRGLLIRDRGGFERSRDVDTVVFDKTGTLTHGRFRVSDLLPSDGVSEEDLLRTAAAVEAQSEHPIAQGIVENQR